MLLLCGYSCEGRPLGWGPSLWGCGGWCVRWAVGVKDRLLLCRGTRKGWPCYRTEMGAEAGVCSSHLGNCPVGSWAEAPGAEAAPLLIPCLWGGRVGRKEVREGH